MNLRRGVLLVALAACLAHWAYYYPRLPETIATHFDGAGRADGWGSKDTAFVLSLVIVLLLGLLFLGLPAVIARLPNSLINLPNKDYWLAPERRAPSLRALQGLLYEYGTATAVLIACVNQLVFTTNLAEEPRLGTFFLWVVGGYLLYTAFWVWILYRRFSRRPAAEESPG